MTKLLKQVIKQEDKNIVKNRINKNVAELKKTIKESGKND